MNTKPASKTATTTKRFSLRTNVRAGEVGAVARAARESGGDMSMEWGTANWGGWYGAKVAYDCYEA